MKKIFFTFIALFCLLHIQALPIQERLIPLPTKINIKEGSFTFNSKTTITTNGHDNIATYFNDKIKMSIGKTLEKAPRNGDISLTLIKDSSLGKEGYYLDVSKNKIEIKAQEEAGLFYGIQTLLQLFPAEVKNTTPIKDFNSWTIDCVEIKDVPAFSWRGLMLDVSRHWFNKEEVMRYIDELAEYKMNVFHWHLTDDQGWRIEIPSFPKLTSVGAWRAPRVGQWWKREKQQPNEEASYGGFYSEKDIKEVLDYAAKRFVRVIPEIDAPGHCLAALVAYPQLACFKAPKTVGVGNKFYGEDENTLCAGNDFTYEFMDKVLTEVARLFPDTYIHIGGDECYKGFWEKCPKCQALMKKEGLKDEKELQSFFIKKMETLLKKKGKKLIGWDEILEGGLAPEATVMSWRGMEGGIKAAKSGHHVIMTPTDHCYLDLWQGEPSVEPDTYSMCRLKDSYFFNPIPEGVDPSFILGSQGNLWTESVPSFRHAEYMTWPRGWALAEVFWHGPSNKNWDNFVRRVEQHFVRAEKAKINYARSMYNAIISSYRLEDNQLEITLDCEVPGTTIYYTFDNTDPDEYTNKYTKPLSIPKNATWLRVVTYLKGKPSGKVITLTIKELENRAVKKEPIIGNLTD